MRRLRIAFVGQKGLPATWGGIETHVEALATRLAARGHEVVATVRRWYTPEGSELPGVELRALPTLHTKHLDATLHSLVAALRVSPAELDVIHFHGLGPSLFSFLPRLRGARVVATVHDLEYQRPKWGALTRQGFRLAEQMALRAPQRTLVVSSAIARDYRARGWEVELFPNGVDRAERLPPLAMRELGLAGGDYVLSLGRFDPSKRLCELIEGYLAIPSPDFRLVVAGGGPGDAYAEKVVRAARGHPGVVFPGVVTGRLKAELLTNAMAYVTTSDHEGMPIALLEAMSYGLPCLAEDIPPHRELLGDLPGGVLHVFEKPAAIADALVDLTALPARERAALGASCRERVESEHDWERRVDRLEALYGELVGA